jgi:hypothetical protein
MSVFRNTRRDRYVGARSSRWRGGYRSRRGDGYRGGGRRGYGGGTSRTASSGGLETAARFGFIARGVAYLVIGVIGFMLAVGTAEHEPNEGGALAAIAEKPLGYLLLWLLAIGFAALALWRFVQAFTVRTRGAGGLRIYAVLSGIAYAIVFLAIFRFVVHGRTPTPSDAVARDVTARILSWDGGQVVVGLIGIVIIAAGIYVTLIGLRLHFLDDLRMGWMTYGARQAVVWLGRIGYLARGLVVIGIGLAALVAAADYDPAEAKGVDLVLRDFADNPFGPWLLILISLGLIAFGVLSFFEARYRRTYDGVPV